MMRDLLGILGFIIAGFCFFAWYGSNKDAGGQSTTAFSESAEQTDAERFDLAGMYADKSLEMPKEVPTSRAKGAAPRSEANLLAAASPGIEVSKSQLQKSIGNLSEMAIASAIDKQKQVPAGASLALLVYSAERGKQLTANNLSRVVDYLLGVKYDASEKDRDQYFKYASNSEKWFAGLALERNGGHPAADLKRIYQAYNLAQFDKDVYAYIVNPDAATIRFDKVVAPKTEAPAALGNASDAEVRRNHAFAKNRWVEKTGSGTDADVKFLPAEETSPGARSEARQTVAALQVGESATFDNPTDYHAAVREIIALEGNYNSWADYEAAVGQSRAKKTFSKRAEEGGFLATGTLRVTRKR